MMAGVRQWELALVAVALLAGCLDSPPAAVSDDDVDDADASVAREDDAGPLNCNSIVRDPFSDTDQWEPYEETDASVVVSENQVHITVADTAAGAWGSITAVPTAPIADTELVAAFTIGEGANGVGGISWAAEVGEGYYDLVVDDTKLEAVDAPEGDDSAIVLCDPNCPDYDPVNHARVRLRATAGTVHFEAAPIVGEWTDIATASIRAGNFESLAYVWADPGRTCDLTVTDMLWRKCAF